MSLNFQQIKKSHNRISPFVKNTEIYQNEDLNREFGNKIYFKCENLQLTSSFKVRGAFNAVLAFKERNGEFPKKVCVASSGNHAQAISYVCREFGIEALIFVDEGVSKVKIAKTRENGAEVVICKTKKEAGEAAFEAQDRGYYFIHPSANEDVILGQGTCFYEFLLSGVVENEIEAVFAPIGGGGLISGSYLASLGFAEFGFLNKPKIIACEPELADDAYRSFSSGEIFGFGQTPKTIADGARTLKMMPLCFEYVRKIHEILLLNEEEIQLWQDRFRNFSEILIEPTSALALAGVWKYIQREKIAGKEFLVVISGGNV